jgi:hypothetical protein
MSQQSGSPNARRHVSSPFHKVIATRYYDGPISGFVAHRDWPHAGVFQLIDWDRETDVRVYELSRVEELSFEAVVERLFMDRRPTWPVWVLPSGIRERGDALLEDHWRTARPIATLTTRDLFGNILVWEPAELTRA